MQIRSMSCAVVVALVAGPVALAGDLAPPAGPVSPTMKDLVEVEPRIAVNSTNTPGTSATVYQISQPGSYYLTENLTGVSGDDGIRITAPDVVLDLNGFTLEGVAGSLDGINLFAGAHRVVIRNGAIVGWGSHGILATGLLGVSVDSVRAAGNGDIGMRTGAYASFTRCYAESNGQDGIISSSPAYFADCVAQGNGDDGFSGGGIIERCISRNNDGWGFNLSTSTSISGCAASFNDLGGYKLLFNTYITRCFADQNTSGPSIFTDRSDNVIVANMVTRGTHGVQVTGPGNLIIGNFASGNSVAEYSIAGSNTAGPIIGVGNPIVSNSPWANFDF